MTNYQIGTVLRVGGTIPQMWSATNIILSVHDDYFRVIHLREDGPSRRFILYKIMMHRFDVEVIAL